MADTKEHSSFVVRLPAEQHHQLRRYAETQDRSMASVVRLALRHYFAEDRDHDQVGAAV